MKLSARLFILAFPLSASGKSPTEGDGSLEVFGIAFPEHGAPVKARQLRHTVPPIITPASCTYSSTHDWDEGLLYDEIFCPDWCGDGLDFTLAVSTVIEPSGGTNTFVDCRIPACTDCPADIGGCPCETVNSFRAVCDLMCPVATPAPTAMPTSEPTPVPTTATPTDAPSPKPQEILVEFLDSPTTVAPADEPPNQPREIVVEYVVNSSSAPSVATVASDFPSLTPSDAPSYVPSDAPSVVPSDAPSLVPSDAPSLVPSDAPSLTPVSDDVVFNDDDDEPESLIEAVVDWLDGWLEFFGVRGGDRNE